LKISIEDIKDTDYACDALILPFTEDDSGFYDKLGLSLSKLIKKIFSKEFRGKPNEVLLIHSPDGFKPARILFVGLGKKDKVSSEQVIQAGGKAAAYLRNMGMQRLSLSTSLLSSLDLSAADFVEGALLGIYTFKKYIEEKDKKKSGAKSGTEQIHNNIIKPETLTFIKYDPQRETRDRKNNLIF